MERFADDIVVIAHGRLVASGPLSELASVRERRVRVRCANARVLGARLRARGLTVTEEDDELVVVGTDPREVGELALAAQIAVHRLVEDEDDLEERYLALTSGPPPRAAASSSPDGGTA